MTATLFASVVAPIQFPFGFLSIVKLILIVVAVGSSRAVVVKSRRRMQRVLDREPDATEETSIKAWMNVVEQERKDGIEPPLTVADAGVSDHIEKTATTNLPSLWTRSQRRRSRVFLWA